MYIDDCTLISLQKLSLGGRIRLFNFFPLFNFIPQFSTINVTQLNNKCHEEIYMIFRKWYIHMHALHSRDSLKAEWLVLKVQSPIPQCIQPSSSKAMLLTYPPLPATLSCRFLYLNSLS